MRLIAWYDWLIDTVLICSCAYLMHTRLLVITGWPIRLQLSFSIVHTLFNFVTHLMHTRFSFTLYRKDKQRSRGWNYTNEYSWPRFNGAWSGNMYIIILSCNDIAASRASSMSCSVIIVSDHALSICVFYICCCVMTILFVSYVDLDKRLKIACSRWSCKCLCNVICIYVCVQDCVCLYVCVRMYVYIGKLDGYYSAWPCNSCCHLYKVMLPHFRITTRTDTNFLCLLSSSFGRLLYFPSL